VGACGVASVEVLEERKVSQLREGEDDITVRVRVLEVGETKTVQTRRGPRTLSEAVVGDDTGRVRLTLWGKHAGSLQEGEAVEIRGAWTTSYRGEVQLNVGYRGEIDRIPDADVPPAEEVPEETPKASSPRRGTRGFYGRSRRPYR
jgi:replication factor A1